MKSLLLRWFINAVALFAVVHLVGGIRVDSFGTLAAAALVIGLLNAFLRPVIMFFSLPVTILTLGLFTLVVNALIFSLAAWLVAGFQVTGFWSAFVGALAFSIVSFLLSLLTGSDR